MGTPKKPKTQDSEKFNAKELIKANSDIVAVLPNIEAECIIAELLEKTTLLLKRYILSNKTSIFEYLETYSVSKIFRYEKGE